ncbi:uncharacterized protein C9orf43 homolog [Pipistrellus kuhlii]|nr:uncharacterized protein C9orf43 homolog [Pipistrellus kuhlii]
MDLPEESQWDETTCNLVACQHPQCWATVRRIERGHPRILGSSCKTSLDVDDKLPVLTIVNLSDTCFKARRRPHSHLRGLTFPKPHYASSQSSKFDFKFQGRPHKDLPDKDLINYPNRPPKGSHKLKKLPVLNLNETQIPCPQDVSNMIVVWIPKESGANVSPAKQYVAPGQDGKKKKRKISTVSSVVLSRKQNRKAKLSTSGITVPPPSPEQLFEPPNSEFVSFLNQFGTLPQDLLKDLLLDEGERSPCLETKTQLAMGKSRPESAVSGQMFLSVHRLTLQRPSLKYPEYLKKLCYNRKIRDRLSSAARYPGLRKQQQSQQQKSKTPSKKPEAKKKSMTDPGSQSTARKSLGHRTLSLGRKSDSNQQPQMENGPILKQDSTERPQTGSAEDHLDSFSIKQSPELSKTESTIKDFGTQIEEVPVAQEETPKDLSSSISRASMIKILRIFQSADDAAEEKKLSGLQSKESPET